MSYMIHGLVKVKSGSTPFERERALLLAVNACLKNDVYLLMGSNVTDFVRKQLKPDPSRGEIPFQLVSTPIGNTAEGLIPGYFKGMDQAHLESSLKRIVAAIQGMADTGLFEEILLCFTDAGDDLPLRSSSLQSLFDDVRQEFASAEDWPEVCLRLPIGKN